MNFISKFCKGLGGGQTWIRTSVIFLKIVNSYKDKSGFFFENFGKDLVGIFRAFFIIFFEGLVEGFFGIIVKVIVRRIRVA